MAGCHNPKKITPTLAISVLETEKSSSIMRLSMLVTAPNN